MPDELDPQLMRWFAQTREPLSDERFMARVTARLPVQRLHWPSFSSAGAILATVLGAVAIGIRAPLRVRHAGLMVLAAAAVTLWSAVQNL